MARLLLIAALGLLVGLSNAQSAGYQATFQRQGASMFMQGVFLNKLPAGKKISKQLSVEAWIKWGDKALQSSIYVGGYPWVINNDQDTNYFQPMAGPGMTGFLFGKQHVIGQELTAQDADQWHHYMVTWESANGTIVGYRDGVQVVKNVGLGHNEDFLSYPSMRFFVGPNYYEFPPSKGLLGSEAQWFWGSIDEIRLYNVVRSAQETSDNYRKSLKNSVPSSLIIYYDFDKGSGATVPNLGNAGANFAATLGYVGDMSADGFSLKKFRYPGSCTDSDVLPSEFTVADLSSLNLTNGIPLPSVTNRAPVAPSILFNTREDAPVILRLGGNIPAPHCAIDPDGDALTFTILTFPKKGYLYNVNNGKLSGKNASSPVNSASPSPTWTTGTMVYVPAEDSVGTDTFTYRASDGKLSSTGTVTIKVSPEDDLPIAKIVSKAADLVLDTKSSLDIMLGSIDAEKKLVGLAITKLPVQGDLFLPSGEKIVEPYSAFALGEVMEQYVDDVIGVSSFWGGPPYAGYHAINIIGRPVCGKGVGVKGECHDERDFTKT